MANVWDDLGLFDNNGDADDADLDAQSDPLDDAWDEYVNEGTPQLSFKEALEGYLANPYDLSSEEKEEIAAHLQEVVKPFYSPPEDERADLEAVLRAISMLSEDEDASCRSHVCDAVFTTIENKFYPDQKFAEKLLSVAISLLGDELEINRITVRKSIATGVQNEPALATFVQNFLLPADEQSPLSDPAPGDTVHENFILETLILLEDIIDKFEHEFRESKLVPHLMTLLQSDNFRIRKGFASIIPAILRSLTKQESIQVPKSPILEQLISSYFHLVRTEEIWGVRKACAISLPVVAKMVTTEQRQTQVADCFDLLAKDESRWVRSAAYKNLGALIATYVPEPPPHDKLEEVLLANLDNKLSAVSDGSDSVDQISQTIAGLHLQSSSTDSQSIAGVPVDSSDTDTQSIIDVTTTSTDADSTNDISGNHENEETEDIQELVSLNAQPKVRPTGKRRVSPAPWDTTKFNDFMTAEKEANAVASQEDKTEDVAEGEDDGTKSTAESLYNSFSYWRPALPSFDLSSLLEELDGGDTQNKENKDEGRASPQANCGSDEIEKRQDKEEEDTKQSPLRGAVPQTLIEHFKIMSEQSSARMIDGDVVRSCAFSIPAVVWALGKDQWHCIRDVYCFLAENLDWKVRASLANSCHVCAMIVGREITEKDLLPIFRTFIRDWEVVRDGAVKNFTNFIRVISPNLRGELIKCLVDLSQLDESHNWRRRQNVIEELRKVLDLVPIGVNILAEMVEPVILLLIVDRVAVVRNLADQTAASLLHLLATYSDNSRTISFRNKLVETLKNSEKSIYRQGFSKICDKFQTLASVSYFEDLVLSELLQLGSDTVPNVKMIVAKTLKRITDTGYVEGRVSCKKVAVVLKKLENDADRDVALHAGGVTRRRQTSTKSVV